MAPIDYALAVGVRTAGRAERYANAHARGHSMLDRASGALPMPGGHEDTANWLCHLRETTFPDGMGEALEGAL